MTIDFEVGKIYDRRKDIHAKFGGQQQGGIATSSQVPVIFLFTGETGKQYGYEDDWGKDNVFLYTAHVNPVYSLHLLNGLMGRHI